MSPLFIILLSPMKKQTNIEWPESEQIVILGWAVPLKEWFTRNEILLSVNHQYLLWITKERF